MDQSNQIFSRYPQNPILLAEDWPYSINTVFNAAATIVNKQTLLLARVEDRQGISHLTVARSINGIENWEIENKPTFVPDKDHPEEQWGVEDPRITLLEDLNEYAVTYTSYSPNGALVSLATTSDFKKWNRIGPILTPDNKDAALFPIKLDGRWCIIHRPMTGLGGSHIWISFSPDLRHWGDHRVLLHARTGPFWDAGKIGLSAQPLYTNRGWLLLYHGVKNTCFGSIYRQGLALLDINNPCKILARTKEWIFSPHTPYERTGDVGNVVFSCGWTLVEDEVRLYYGSADTSISLATAKLDDLFGALDCQTSGSYILS